MGNKTGSIQDNEAGSIQDNKAESSAGETSAADESPTSGANSLMSLSDAQAKFSIAATVATVWSISCCGVT